MKSHDEEKLEEFIGAIKQYILYWERQKDASSFDKLEGLAHSFLCILDGVSGSFDGSIQDIAKLGNNFMLHDHLYKKET